MDATTKGTVMHASRLSPSTVLGRGEAPLRRQPPPLGAARGAVLTLLCAGILLAPGVSRASLGDCGQPLTAGPEAVSADCLYILRAAVDLQPCTPACSCATSGSLPIRSADALRCLRATVGLAADIHCPADCTGHPDPLSIASMDPLEGTVGTTITITGRGLGAEDLALFLAGDTDTALEVVEAGPDHAVARIAVGLPAGDYAVKALRGEATTLGSERFSVRLPSDLAFAPALTGPGEPVTMDAAFLGTEPGTVTLRAQADPTATEYGAEVVSWTNERAVFVMSSALPVDGPVDVTVSNAVGSRTAALGVTYDGGPRIVGALATSNTEVIVEFSERVGDGTAGAENPARYRIAGPAQARTPTLGIVAATLIAPRFSSVRLTTLSQTDMEYRLTASGIYDLNDNPIPAPTPFVNPATTTFLGLAPSGPQIDSDGDGLTDSDEQRGWLVTVFLGEVEVGFWHVTSDPGNPNLDVDDPVNVAARDTDGDGVTDNEEKHGGMDPRSPDTDGDILTDNEEWNVIYSDPKNQDSDGDGTQDGFEFYSYRTSPLLADTDGDQIDDTEEVTGRNRDPRIADIPRSGITVGEVRLQIQERYSYEDGSGSVATLDSSSSTSLSETQSRQNAEMETKLVELTIAGGIDFEPLAIPPSFTLRGSVQLRGSYSMETSTESAVESQKVHDRSVHKADELSSTSNATREVIGASIDVDLTLLNKGDISFALRNVEVTVFERDPQASDRLVPVATLVPHKTLVTGEPVVYNLGPFTPEKGPVLFSSLDVDADLVDALLKAPAGLIFEVSNFDMTDEFGRIFTFSNQIARDRTAGIIVDGGDGIIDRHYVATALQPDPDGFGGAAGGFVGGFNSDGSPVGIPLDFALQDILELSKKPAGGCAWSPPASTSTAGCDGIVAGLDTTADSRAAGDDVQLVPVGTDGISVGTIVIGAGQNGVLETVPAGDDTADVVTGYETSSTCSAESSTAGLVCASDGECSGGTCSGPEVLVRFGSLRNGDFNRQWVVLTSGNVPAGADFGQVTLKPGMDLYLAFVQDLDGDGLFAREEFLLGSTDSSADLYPNKSFSRYFEPFSPAPSGPNGPDGIPDSKDTDRDGIGDYAEVRVGWKVDSGAGYLRQVYSSPRLRDSDGDGVLDPVEKDLREFCFASGLDRSMPAVCSFLTEPAVAKADAVAIVAGPNGVADSVAASGDQTVVAQGSHCKDCYWPAEYLGYGDVVISVGTQAGIQTNLLGDDRYVSASLSPPPATDPTLSDTDTDTIEDGTELGGYIVGFGLRDGGNGVAETRAEGDDIQKVAVGHPVKPHGLVLLPGPNGKIDTVAGGDEVQPQIYSGSNSVFETVKAGDDEYCCGDQLIVAGANELLDSIAAGDDYPIPGPVPYGRPAQTDPLRLDSDDDLVSDGRELELGASPNYAGDGADFVDSDRDGLTDAEETELGWNIYVNGGAALLVHSNPYRPDSDFDGLPDLVERDVRSNPNREDTDRDGLSDFDEFGRFEDYAGLASIYAGFDLDGSTSARYGTKLDDDDTDQDSCDDYFETTTGGHILLRGGELREFFTNPLEEDTDFDGIDDCDELGYSDPTDPDTDDDGRFDGAEQTAGTDPLVPDLAVEIKVLGLRGFNANVDAVDGEGIDHDMTWWFTTLAPGSVSPKLLTRTDMMEPNSGTPFVLESALFCFVYEMKPGAYYSLYHDFDGSDTHYQDPPGTPGRGVGYGKETIKLEQGESFTLSGIIGEIDIVAADCGVAPYFVPSYVKDDQNCVANFSESFSYADFTSGGSIGSVDASFRSTKCEFTLSYSLTVK